MNIVDDEYPLPKSTFSATDHCFEVSPKIFQILAFGDSLTEGWYNSGLKTNPYSNRLKELLDLEFPGKFDITCMGIAGEKTKEMELRLSETLKYATDKNIHYSHVIILGGTNDLPKYSEHEIFNNLCNMYNMVEALNSKVIALTIPQAYFTTEWYVKKREEVNKKIKDKGRERNFVVVDIETAIPYEKIKDKGRERNFVVVDKETAIPYGTKNELWDDSLHFSKKGYDRMGELIFQEIKSELTAFLGDKIND